MTKTIAILRGINVGGKRKILMADLKALFEGLGLHQPTTYIQSGNVIFDAEEGRTQVELAQAIERAIAEAFGFDVPVILRSPSELEAAVAQNPFCQAGTDIGHLHLAFLSEAPAQSQKEALESMDFGPDRLAVNGKDAFVYCEGKYHESKLTNGFLEQKLKVKATTRNWKTVRKLLELSRA